MDLEADSTVRFFSDLEMRWNEDDPRPRITYEIELVQHGAVVGRSTCDPFYVLYKGFAAMCGARMLWSDRAALQCLMHDCELRVPESGPTEVRVRFVVSRSPRDLVIERANLIVKQ